MWFVYNRPHHMRAVSALFVVSVLLFLCGVGFVVIGARAARNRPATPAADAALTPVASVRQIMHTIVEPAADTVFGAVSTIVTAAGTEEKQPRTDEEWEAVAGSAAALVESGNLLLMGSRAIDKGAWTTYARDLVEAGRVALKAAEARDAAGVFASGEAIYLACDNCHRTYQRTE
jgi:hypothetical protein